MLPNAKASELIAVLDVVNPSSQAPGAVSTGWVSAADYHRFLAVLQLGVLGASGTVDAKIQQATDGAGTGAKDVTGKAITQITATNNQQKLIDVQADDLDVSGGFNYIRLTVTTAVAASLTSVVLLGAYPRYAAVTQATSVKEVVG